MEVTSTASLEDENSIIEATRQYNRGYTEKDVLPLCVFDRSMDGTVIGGLTGKTYWNYLDIGFSWVNETCRNQGRASSILKAAEDEAYSVQALGFYL